ncbi:hypothetical protein [Mycolicibacterium sp. P1-18]|uniref:hypothetical protein n=1 Tax=Mycolicibacterium sp. P1-18 TaxID=2024615 RepID=UPI0011F37C6D|nr:hypothetical protein [Mycolicibacterium sp. P1-18]
MLFDESFGLSGQMWLDMQFLGQTLLDSSTGVSADWPADAAAGPALSDAWRAAESFLPMAPHVGNEIADQLFTELPSAALGSGFRPDPRLTTRAIWESACTLDELDVEAPDRAHDRNDHRRLVDIKIKSDAYGLALRVAANLAGSLSSPLFRLITWLATDPPVPFLTPFGGEIRWSAFHPPYRFMRLYSAVRDHRRFRKFPFAADLYEFSDDLLQAAGLERANWPTTPVTNPLLTREGDRNVAVHDWAADYELHPGSSQKHAGSLNMLAKASLALRAAYVDAPRSFVYPKIDTLYFSVKDYDSWVFDTQAAHSLLQPFALDFKDGLHSGGFFPDGDLARLSKTHLTNYVTSLLFRESLEALIRGTTARRNHLPREFREWGLGQATPIEQLLLGNYVVEIDW